jgi:hypothetical protein
LRNLALQVCHCSHLAILSSEKPYLRN